MNEIYPVPEEFKKTARTVEADYFKRYQHSIENPDEFWAEQAKIVDWIKPFTQVKNTSFDKDNFKIEWFADGELNVSANCLDRHLKEHPHKPAIIWEGDHPSRHKIVSYKELHDEVCRFANVLKKYGIGKGDRVVLYMPMVTEAAIAMLACARIGAVHCVVFGGFSPDSLASRIEDSQAKLVITADSSLRAGKLLPLKENVDLALALPGTECVENVIVVYRNANPIEMKPGRDLWYHLVIMEVDANCPPEPMKAEDPLFILYTSGSTGKPKGVLHTTGGYLVYVTSTFKEVFDLKQDDVYWCTADIGWITGHSYLIYGPLANGTTTLMFEGVPQYPTWARLGHVVDKHKVSILYTAPTAIRAMMREGDSFVRESNRSSLRLLGSVGEPINPEAWNWYYNVVGEGRCPIVDTWWQTETGGILIAPLPGATALKPGSATRPLFGIQPAIVDGEGNELEGAVEDIQIRATFLRSPDGRRIVIPNATVYTSAVTVNTAYQRRRCEFVVGIGYEDDVQKAKAVILKLLDNSRNVLSQPAFSVNVTALADFSVNLTVRWWVDTTETTTSASISEIQELVVDAFDENNISIPYPVQEVKVYRGDQATEETVKPNA